jgi:AcrR family transcriptional regulator
MPDSIDKKTAILKATLKVAAKHGLTGLTMSQIAKEAKASPGIIYHYFESKDEIITTLFNTIEDDYFKALTAGQPFEMEFRESLKYVWLTTFDYFLNRPEELVFYEQYKNSIYYDKHGKIEDNPKWAAFSKVLRGYIEQGLMKDWPFEVLYHMTSGLAARLAKLQHAGAISLDRKTLEAIADTCCRSIEG